jgi:hypothetical protein
MIRLLIIAVVSVFSLSVHSATPASDPVSAASTASEERQTEEAVKIVQSYMSQLSQNGMDGKTVHDVSVLPNSKLEITAALLKLMVMTTEPETRANFKSGLMVLAFFQPDIGPTPVGLDQIGPEQKAWQEVVDQEMQELNATLSEQSF